MINRTPIEDGILNGAKIVIQNHNVPRIACRLCAASHRKADIRTAQRRRIVHTVACHANDKIHLLRKAHNARFIRRQSTRNDHELRQNAAQLIIRHLSKVTTREYQIPILVQQSCITCNGNSSLTAISCHHDDLNPRCPHLGDCLTRLRTHIITNGGKTDENCISIDFIFDKCLTGKAKRQYAHGTRGIGVYFLIECICVKGGDCPI